MTDAAHDSQATKFYAQGFMSAPEAAQRSGYDQSHLYRLLKAGTVEGFKVGARAWYVRRLSLVAYLGEEGARRLGLDTPLPGEAEALASVAATPTLPAPGGAPGDLAEPVAGPR